MRPRPCHARAVRTCRGSHARVNSGPPQMYQHLHVNCSFFNNGRILFHHTNHNHAAAAICLATHASQASERRRVTDAEAALVGRGGSGGGGMARARLHHWWMRLQTGTAMWIEQKATCVSLASLELRVQCELCSRRQGILRRQQQVNTELTAAAHACPPPGSRTSLPPLFARQRGSSHTGGPGRHHLRGAAKCVCHVVACFLSHFCVLRWC